MEYKVIKEPENGLSCVIVCGDVHLDDFPSMLRELWSDADYTKSSIAIWDFSDSNVKLGFEEVAELTDFVKTNKSMRGPTSIAIVASRDLEFGMGRMYGGFSGSLEDEFNYRVNVFRTQEQARAWLLDLT